MVCTITHETRYVYARSVFLEPQTIRLRPRSDTTQRLLRFTLEISPLPAGCSDLLELDGNTVATVWFSAPQSLFLVTSHSTVETLQSNPFDYLLEVEAERLPVMYRPLLAERLAPYYGQYAAGPAVASLVAELRSQTSSKTVAFLMALNHQLSASIQPVTRFSGDPLLPEDTLARCEGACRDVTAVFMSACDSVGLATRFISGYHIAEVQDGRQELHAWAEVYLPGAGWRGYDPSLGLVVADRHVAVAAGPSHRHVRPVEGTYRGEGAPVKMTTSVRIEGDDLSGS